MDETGFRIGIGRDQWIITREPTRPAYLASSSERKLVTCVKAISRDGTVIPPMVILRGANHLEKWVDNDLEDDTLYLGNWIFKRHN